MFFVKIAIISDGSYGERAYETISQKFKTNFIKLEAPKGIFIDEIKINSQVVDKISKFDLLITYILHPDLTQALVEQVHDKVEWIIIGAWRGEGFKKQLTKFGNVTAPENMCDLEKNGNPIFDEFLSKFGRPKISLTCQENKILNIEVKRSSPCGATLFVAEELKGTSIENLPIRAGLKVQHYPCRAPKIRLFSDEECKKDLAANLHKEAFKKALKNIKDA